MKLREKSSPRSRNFQIRFNITFPFTPKCSKMSAFVRGFQLKCVKLLSLQCVLHDLIILTTFLQENSYEVLRYT